MMITKVKFFLPLVLGLLCGCGGGGGRAGSQPSSPIVGSSNPAAPSEVSARFHVDVGTGQVTIAKSSPASRTIFSGTAIGFNSSTLFNLAGSNGTRVLSVSLTNNAGLAIGADPNGVANGLNVIFSGFTNVGSFPDVRSQTSVNTIATGFSADSGIVAAGSGVFYVADTAHNQIKKISGGVVSVLAGKTTAGEIDGPGSSATFTRPTGIALNPVDGSLVVSDETGQKIRRVTQSGQVSTIAGTGAAGVIEGAGTSATFNLPWGVAVDPSGTIYVAEFQNNDVRAISFNGGDPSVAANYTVRLLAGGSAGFTDGTGVAAKFRIPTGVAFSGGVLYVADTDNNAVRAITPSGDVTTIAGTGATGILDGPGNAATFNHPAGIADVNGAVLVSEGSTAAGAVNVRQITPIQGASTSTSAGWQTSTLAGNGTPGNVNGPGNIAEFNNPQGLAADASGNVYVADAANGSVRIITPNNGIIPVGVPTGGTPSAELVQLSNATGQADSATPDQTFPFINYPGKIANAATTAAQQWWFTVPTGVTAFEFDVTVQAATQGLISPGGQTGQGDPTEIVSTYAGDLVGSGYTDGALIGARFGESFGIARFPTTSPGDPLAGCLVLSDTENNAIRMVTPSGQVCTIAGGNGVVSADGPGNSAGFAGSLRGLTVGAGDELFVCDSTVLRLVKFNGTGSPTDSANWTVSTIAGSASASGDVNGNGPVARFQFLEAVTQSDGTTLFVTDFLSNNVRMLRLVGGNPSVATNWQVSQYAGNGSAGHADGPGASATFINPVGITSDTHGNLYVVDRGNMEIRKITPGDIVSTVAGSFATPGYQDGAVAELNTPQAIATDSAGYVYFSDGSLNADCILRRLSPGGVVSTLAGSPTVAAGVDGPGNTARFVDVNGIVVTPEGDIWVADDQTIRLIQKQISVGANARPAKKK